MSEGVGVIYGIGTLAGLIFLPMYIGIERSDDIQYARDEWYRAAERGEASGYPVPPPVVWMLAVALAAPLWPLTLPLGIATYFALEARKVRALKRAAEEKRIERILRENP